MLIRLNANVDQEQAKRLKHALVDEGLSFSEWLRRQIEAYLSEKEPKRAGVRELVDRRKLKRWTDSPKETGKKTREPKGKKRKGKEG